MWRTAESPRKGMEPWAMRPFVSISAHQTPRWPRQIRSLCRGSGMMTLTRSGENQPCSGEVGTPPKPPILVGGGGDLDRGKAGADGDECLGGNDAGRKPALHVAGAATVDAVPLDPGPERIAGPAVADLDHVVMGVEMDAVAGARAVMARDEVPARMGVAVAKGPLRADQRHREAGPRKPRREVIADLAVVVPGGIEGRDADQIPGQRDKVVAAGGDFLGDPFVQHSGHGGKASAGGGGPQAGRHLWRDGGERFWNIPLRGPFAAAPRRTYCNND